MPWEPQPPAPPPRPAAAPATNGHADLKQERRQRAGFSDATEKVDKLPPHSPESEQGVLGCILLSPQSCVAEAVAGGLTPDSFYDLRHQTVFDTIVKMTDDREAVDIITLSQKLKDNQRLAEVGGVAYLNSLPDTVPSAANLSYYLDIVLEKEVLRRIVHTCTEAAVRVRDHEGEVDNLLDEVERDILAIRRSAAIPDTKSLIRSSLDRIELMHEQRGTVGGIATGFTDVDKLTDGLHGSEMIVLAGETKGGKTSFALNVVDHAAVALALPVGIFSLEMSAESLVTRMLFTRSRINARSVRDQGMTERDFPALTSAAARLNAAKLFIDDTGGLTVSQLRARARRWVQQHGVKLLVVDYLQLLSAPEVSKRGSREQEVAAISKGLKGMAKELGVPVLVLIQLNALGKARESLAIEQDLDALWVLKRQEDDEKKNVNREAWQVNLEVELCRNGPTGYAPLTFLAGITKFESCAKVSDDEPPQESR